MAASKAGGDGPSPLDILLTVMRDRWEAGQHAAAVAIARIAAPFVHPRLAAPRRPAAQADQKLDLLSDAELARLLDTVPPGDGDAPDDPAVPDRLVLPGPGR